MTEAVSQAMREDIETALSAIEAEEGVRILFAIESGSRAWGFHSPDSDYDVRFVYARPRAWFYKLGKKRDVIECPIDDVLDLSGWELSKALELAPGSNAVIAEWLQSPIRYRALPEVVERLSEFAEAALDRKSVTWHYLSLLRRQEARVRDPEGALRVKRWFYMLRPALALRWLRLNDKAMPPMDLAQLRAGTNLDPDQQQAIDALLVLKLAAKEKATMPDVNPRLDDLITGERHLAEAWVSEAPRHETRALWQAASLLHLELSEAAFK